MIETTVKVPLPEMGESVTEGSIVEWRKQPGQWVEAGETLVEVTTDKVDVEVPSPAAGVVKAVLVAEGATVAVGTALAEIDTAAQRPAGGAAAPPPAAKPAAPAPVAAPAAGNGAPTPAAGKPSGIATPQARRVADRSGIDISQVPGTGPDGLVLRHDVDAAILKGIAKAVSGPPALPLPPLPAEATIVPLKGPAAALVGYMDQSLTIPTATSFRTISVTMLDVKRRQLNEALAAAGRPEKLSFTHLIAYALVRAAVDVPGMTSSFRRENGVPVRVDAPMNLGLAVDASRKDGSRFLVVPVIKRAETMDFPAFRESYEALVVKARDNKLGTDDLSGGTFTLTNPGGIGTVASVPRLMAGQGTIIAAGAIGYPPGFTKADAKTLQHLGVEKVLTLTSTYDHRVIQGAQSGEYLKRVEQLLADTTFYDAIFAAFGVKAPDAVSSAPVTAALEAAPATTSGAMSEELLRAVAAGAAIVSAYRAHGHMAATLDPLGAQPPGDPSLDPPAYGLTPAMMNAVPAAALRTKVGGDTLTAVLARLRETYASTIAYEIEHISNRDQRHWLRNYIESGLHRVKLSPERKVQLLGRLTKVETMERYLRKFFLGQKTFSIEGVDVMIPMLEETISMLADDGTKTAVLGMAHRGRLATIAHVVNQPYEEILGEFEAAKVRGEVDEESDSLGDVKYHHGAEGIYVTPAGTKIEVRLGSNPSHLEAIDGVVEGTTRALQTDHHANPGPLDLSAAAPILIHGDASFPGQGVVAEVLNLQSLKGYATGGTIHIIANNQLGFTTDPSDSRSTRYASDLAKGFDVPIVHVNADDVEACISAVHLALDFRSKFGRDVLIDLIGYRRFGHNEQDEPAYTQPGMYDRIKNHPTVRELFAGKLVAEGVIKPEQAQALVDEANKRITEQHELARKSAATMITQHATDYSAEESKDSPIEADRLLGWSRELMSVPEGFTVNPKLTRQFEKRLQTFETSGELDWGLAESLAFAALTSDGIPVRITGQDTERGTFSHRHAVYHDPKTGASYTPLKHLASAKASFEIFNSPLSEYACMGFEYGYSVAVQEALVLWEAQFGDFNNGAQIIIDQFLAAGLAKWDQPSRLTLLLPHGYEGMGPEHSSARIERFLQLSAEGNIRVAYPSTASQYFHLLRMQARQKHAFPMVIFTPKSLLRAPTAFGTLTELATGHFKQLIDDPKMSLHPEEVQRIILCSGKIYHDLINDPDYAKLKKTAIARIELLSPLPRENILRLIERYPNAKQLVWVQEEPKNMGARAHVRRRLIERLPVRIADIDYIGRPYRASPSEGYPGAHAGEQERIIKLALTE